MRFEYRSAMFYFGDLANLNTLGGLGWEVVTIIDAEHGCFQALLKRVVPESPLFLTPTPTLTAETLPR